MPDGRGTLDDGGRPGRRRLPPGLTLGAAVAVAVGVTAAIWGPSLRVHRREAIATARAWMLTGPPCQALAPAAYARQWFKATKAFEWDGATFARGAGHADCQDVTNGGGKGFGVHPVCQFTSPQVIAVTTGKGVFYFTPGLGKPATVTVQHGIPSCVATSEFTLR